MLMINGKAFSSSIDPASTPFGWSLSDCPFMSHHHITLSIQFFNFIQWHLSNAFEYYFKRAPEHALLLACLFNPGVKYSVTMMQQRHNTTICNSTLTLLPAMNNIFTILPRFSVCNTWQTCSRIISIFSSGAALGQPTPHSKLCIKCSFCAPLEYNRTKWF